MAPQSLLSISPTTLHSLLLPYIPSSYLSCIPSSLLLTHCLPQSFRFSVRPSVRLSVRFTVSPCVRGSVCPSFRPSFILTSVCPFVHPSARPLARPIIHPSRCPSVQFYRSQSVCSICFQSFLYPFCKILQK